MSSKLIILTHLPNRCQYYTQTEDCRTKYRTSCSRAFQVSETCYFAVYNSNGNNTAYYKDPHGDVGNTKMQAVETDRSLRRNSN